MTKIIKKPAPIQLVNLRNGEPINEAPVSFEDFVLGALSADGRFSQGLGAIYAGRHVVQAFATPGATVEIDSTVWAILREALLQPSGGCYPGFKPGALYQLTAFYEAILQAEDKPEVIPEVPQEEAVSEQKD